MKLIYYLLTDVRSSCIANITT